MKRIFAFALTLVLALAALTGCIASQTPSGKRLPMTMTIAETLPSCTAFEYKDGKPYCFYAYDPEGKLYRVLWTDFAGLNEKDVILVDHEDAVKSLTYEEYPSGWTPQYEITAVRVKMEQKANEHLVRHIQIKSGANTVYPFGMLLWEKIDNGDGTFTEVMLNTEDIISIISDNSSIPKLVLDERVSYAVQVNGRIEKVELLTPNGDKYTKSETTFDTLSTLADGTYYVVLNVLLSGNCDPDAPQHSYRYEDVFRLVVGADDPFDASDMITHSAGDILSQKVLNGSDRQMILNILGSGKEWASAIPECDWVCRFSGACGSIGYCDCGTVSDFVNHRSRKLDAEERESIAALISRDHAANHPNRFSYTELQWGCKKTLSLRGGRRPTWQSHNILETKL